MALINGRVVVGMHWEWRVNRFANLSQTEENAWKLTAGFEPEHNEMMHQNGNIRKRVWAVGDKDADFGFGW